MVRFDLFLTPNTMASHYPHEIEQAFNNLKDMVKSRARGSTSCDDVLRFMYENQQQIWFMSWDFINETTKDGSFLSHRAPARASDLAIYDPQLVEDRKIGRYKAYRLRLENVHLIEMRLGVTKKTEPKKMEVEHCPHGVPSYVRCPNCLKI